MSARPFLTRWRPLATACCCGAALLLLLLLSAPARAERAWPELALPADAQAWSVGEQFSANGVPLRVRGFLSPRPLNALVREMRQQLGEPVVHSRVGNKVILGRAEAGFYLTLQLEPVAGGTRALLAVADFETARRQRPATQAFTQRWLQRLPAGSQILSHSSARDGALWSTQLVYRNGASAALNSQALAAVLAQDGLEPARESDTGGDRVLLLKGPGQEASAVIVRLPDGQSSVVLNTVSASRAEDRP